MRSFLFFLFALLATSALAQNNGGSAEWLAERGAAPFVKSQGMTAEQVWKHPWHYIVLFNSANSGSHSAYTDAAKSMAVKFLESRASEGNAGSTISFFPYQLDLYQSPDKSLKDQPLTSDSVDRVEKLWPTRPYQTLADGKTPYKGVGHDNVGARVQALKLAGPPTAGHPILVMQFTDTDVNEAPRSSTDDLVRDRDGRLAELDQSSYTAYEVPGQPFDEGPNQKLYAWIYGPTSLTKVAGDAKAATPVAPPETPAKSGSGALIAGVVLVLAAVAAAAFFLLKPKGGASGGGGGGGKRASVQIPGNGPVVLAPGESLTVVTAGAKETGNIAVLEAKEFPTAKLFEILNDKGKLKALSAFATVEDGVGNRQPNLVNGDNELILKQGTRMRKVKITVTSV